MLTTPQPPDSTITIRRGDTLSYGGVVALPAGNWSATCSLGAVGSIHVNLSPIGPSPNDPTRNEWTIALEASSAETGAWQISPSYPKTLREVEARIRFQDDSNPPIVKSSAPFKVLIES